LKSQDALTQRGQEEKEAKRAEVLRLIAEVELVKQLRISDSERALLCDRLLELSEPIERTRQRAKNVERNTTYKSIAFEYWLGAEDLYTAAEVEMIVEQRIRERAERYRKLHFDEEKLAAMGLVNLQTFAARKQAELLEQKQAEWKSRCRQARLFLRKAPESVLVEVKYLCEKKKLIKDDSFWKQSIYQYIPENLIEIEELMRRMPEKFEEAK
jgi:hypothetical protein